jgi:uncharacterized protein involved in outer membrane biogenesis
MSKNVKILLIILAIPVVLIAGAAVFLKVYFTSDRLKALIIPEVEEATQRRVAVGDVSLSLLPRFAVTMEQLTISAPQGMKFEREEFLSLDELLLDINLFALLKDRIEIDEIVLTRPKLYLEVTKGGIANYSQPKKAEEPPAQPRGVEPAEQTPLGVMLTNFRINNGELLYVDKQADRRVQISDYQQTMSANVSGGNVFFESESHIGGLSYGSTKSFLVSDLPIVTYQRLTYKQAEDMLLLDSISLGIRQIALVLKGKVEHVLTTPSLNLSLTSTKADVAQLLSLVPKEYMKAAEGLSSSGEFQFTMDIKGIVSDSAQPAMRGTFTVSNGTIRYAALPKSITGINVAGSFEQPPMLKGRKQPGRFMMEKFTANFGTSTMTGKLGVTDFDDPALSASFKGNMNLGEVREYYPLEQGTEVTGTIAADFSIAGKARAPTSLKADGRLEFKNVTVKTATSPKPLRNLNGTITFNNQLIDSKQLSMDVGESDMQLAFTMRNYLGLVMEDAASVGKPAMHASLTSRRLKTADLMSDESLDESKGTKQTAPSASGKGKQAALLPNMDVDANVTIGTLETEKFEFQNAEGSVKIRDGIITLQNFSVNAFQGNIVTKGTLDVRRMDKRPFNLDLEINGVEANAFLPKFTSFGNNLFGKFSMNTSVKGDLNDTLGLDTQTLSGNGRVQVSDGKLIGYPLTTKLANYTGVSELREVQFKNWSNAYSIADGRIHVKDLKVVAAQSDFVVNGSQGFDGSLDYRMLVRLPESVSGRLRIGGIGAELINFLKDDEGRINLNFKVTGTSADPAFALDTENAQRKAKQALELKAREEADRLKKKAEEELKKKAEEGLKKLFPKKQ